MQRLNIKTKLTLIVGFITTIVATLAVLFIVQIVFYSIETQIKKDLNKHHKEITALAMPEKSMELATYLRSNDLSLYIFNDNNETIARYGIYRDLDSKTLHEFTNLPIYIDREILDFGEYDIYTENNIQVSTKNNVLFILKKSIYLTLIILLPIIWLISVVVAGYATKIIISPLLKATNISHELKNPLARVASSLQVLIDTSPIKMKNELKSLSNELIQLGGNVDSILSLSLLQKNNKKQENYTNVKREVDKQLKIIPDNVNVSLKINPNLIVPVNLSFMGIIFRNLIDNAIKYNTKNGYIKISANKKGNNWTFQISNTTSKKPSKKGYGLGMTIVEDICHNHGIKIDIANSNDIFSVKLVGKLYE
jgi:two-component sensor histidine kinase